MIESPTEPFSARNGTQHRHIDSEFPATARNGVLHLLFDLVSKHYVHGWAEIATELQRIARLPPSDYESPRVSKIRKAREDAELAWEKAYDFCERLYGHLACEVAYYDDDGRHVVKTSRGEVQAYIESEIQRIFSEEGLAFEFSDGIVRRSGRKHTVDMASRAHVVLGAARLESARKHYNKALQFFRNPSKPDFENSVKEAVCAVEAAGKALFPTARASTLGDLAKWLATAKDVSVPKALCSTITAVYTYRSGGDGVGHGGTSGGAATAEVAEYMLAVCASQVIYLVDLANAQEGNIPF